MQNIFNNNLVKLIYSLVIILPFIFLWLRGLNLFNNNVFVVIYIIALILLSLNSLTDFTMEIPGLKFTIKNTGASLEANADLKNKTIRAQMHGGVDDTKVNKLTKELFKEIKNAE